MWTVYVVSFFCICYQSLQEVMDSCEVLTHRLLASRMFSLGTLRDASQEWQSWCLLQLHLRLVLLFLTWRFLPSTIGLLDGEEVTHLWLICAFHLCFCPCSRVGLLRQKADIWRFEHIWEYFDFVVVTILSVYLMEIHLSFFAFEHAQFFCRQQSLILIYVEHCLRHTLRHVPLINSNTSTHHFQIEQWFWLLWWPLKLLRHTESRVD